MAPDAADEVKAVWTTTSQLDLATLAYSHALSTLEQPVWLALDNYQQAESEAVDHMVETLIEHLPDTCRVVISSRCEPRLPLIRWEIDGRLARLTIEQLRLTSAEIAEFMGLSLERPVDPSEVELLDDCFQGWPLGLALTAQMFRGQPRRELARALKASHGLTGKVAAYLDQEVMRGQDANLDELDLLMHSAILSELAIYVCNDLLDIPNAGELLHRLCQRGLFITPHDELATIYDIHPLFRRFLLDRLQRSVNRATLQALHLKAARIYHQRQLWIRAISHYTQAEEYSAAAEILLQEGVALLETAAVRTSIPYLRPSEQINPAALVLDWLNALPPSILETYPRLLILQGWALLNQQDYAAALEVVEHARLSLAASGDTLELTRADVTRAYVEAGLGRHAEALTLLQAAQEGAQAERLLHAQTLLGLCASHHALGNVSAAVETGEEALRVAAGVTERAGRSLEMQITQRLALAHLDLGRLDLAQAMAEVAWMICAEHHVGSLAQRAACLETYIQVLVAAGQFTAARALIGQATSPPPDFEGAVATPQLSVIQAEMALVEQDYTRAADCIRQAGQPPWPLIHLKAALAEWAEARLLVELELTTLETEGSTHISQRQRYIGFAWLGVIEAQLGYTQDALAHLSSAIHFFTERGLEFLRAGAELHLAWLLPRVGQRTRAKRTLERVVEYGARTNTLAFPFWLPDVVGFNCAEALSAEMEPTYVVALASQLKVGQARYFQPLLQHASRDVQRHAAAIVDRLGVARGETRLRRQLVSATSPVARPLSEVGERLTPEGRAKLANAYLLTPREIEVLKLYLDPDVRGGATRVNDAIAVQLHLAPTTVRDYISNILKKLGVQGRDRLRVRSWAIEERIVEN